VVMGTSLGANTTLEVASLAPERLRGMVIEMPVLDHALLGAAVAFTPLMLGLTFGAPAARALARAARVLPSRRLPWQAGILVDWVAQDPEPSAAVVQGLFFGRTLMAARGRFVVDQVRIRRPNILKTSDPQSQAEIDVVKTDRQVRFIESACLFENLFPDQKARARHGRTVLLQIGAIEKTGMTARDAGKGVSRHAPEAQNDPTVLQRAVWIPQARPDGADSRAHGMAHHLAQPIGLVRIDIVVQKREHFPFRGSGAAID